MFSVIIANPPFNGKSVNHKKLWPEFIRKAAKYDNLAFVVPNSWINTDKKQFADIQHLLWTKGTTYVDYDITDKYFSFIGESICYFINTSGQSCWDANNKKIYSNNLDTFKTKELVIWEKIRDKVIHSSYPKLPIICNNTVRTASLLSDDTSLTRVYYSRSQYFNKNRRYADVCKDNNYSKLKIVFNRTAWTGKLEEYMFADKDITTGVWASYCLVQDEEQSNSIISYFSTKLFKYLMGRRPKDAYAPYMNDWMTNDVLPLLPTKHYTDADVYSLFNITKEEISEIEKCGT